MPALAPDPARPTITDRSGDDDRPSPDRPAADRTGSDGLLGPVADPTDADPATARLRALLAPGDPWHERVGGTRVHDLLDLVGARRAVAVVVAAAVIGVAAFVVVGAGSTSSVDPVQVLPRVAPVTDPGAAADRPAPGVPPPGSGTVGAGPAGPGSSVPLPATIQVHAAGAVVVAGVHQLADGSRVADLIQVAGGLAPDADPDRINLAAPIHDGERVYVPRRGEADAPAVVAGGTGGPPGGGAGGSPGDGSSPSTTAASRVDINTADAAALDGLPGVGPATADAIIRHRTANGPFRSVEDLQEVTGIGPAKLDRLRDLVRVG